MREAILLHKLKNGDPSGLEGLMDIYTPYVSAIVWNILRGAMSPEDAEEVVSDVFLAAWDRASDIQTGHLKGWLAAVARNRAKNKLRQKGKTLPLDDSILEIPSQDNIAEEMERKEEAEVIRHAVDSMQVKDREVFLRHYYYAQSVKEISIYMALNESTVKTKLWRGRKKLKEALTKEGNLYET